MKKAAIATIIAIIILGGAAYGHRREVLANEKITIQNEVALMQQEIQGGNIQGANASLVKIMQSHYPLTQEQEASYKTQIDDITAKTTKAKVTIDNTQDETIKNIIATYLNVNSIDNMEGISEASVNGAPFYVATEGAAPNGKLENLDKAIKPITIFKGVEGYKFSMRAINSKVNEYFYVSKDGVVYNWENILDGFKNGILVADISSGLNSNNPTDLNKFVGEFGPSSGSNVYKIWNRKEN
ncbi:MAG: hypothetical protein ACRCTZ_02375 [Sarcina sp.]